MTTKKRNRIVLSLGAVMSLAGLSTPHASAQTSYTIVPSATQLDWNSAASWNPNTGTPGITAGDTAIVSGAFGGVAETVDLSAPLGNGLALLVIGDTSGAGTTSVTTGNASNLLFAPDASITSLGTVSAATNLISAPVTLGGNLTVGSYTPGDPVVPILATNNLTISGKITASGGVSAIYNPSTFTVSLSDIDLSGGTLTIRNSGAATTRTNLTGVIADGTSASNLTLSSLIAGTTFQIDGTNTYTGATTLLPQGEANATTFIINSTLPFGTGALSVSNGGANATATFEIMGADRTIANSSVILHRSTVYNGSHGLTFTGPVSGGATRAITNNLTGGRLVFNNGYTTSIVNTDDARTISVGGNGTTVFNGTLSDSPVPTVDQFATINVTGASPTVIIGGTATIQGDFRIALGGTVQLGDGGVTGVITPSFGKKSVVTGGTNATGFLAVNHSDAITLSSTINAGLGLKQIGSGDLTVATPQFNHGANQIGDGINPSKLVVTSGVVNETTQVGDVLPTQFKGDGFNVRYQIINNLSDTSSLTVGQPVYLGGVPSSAVYIHTIDSPTQVTLYGTGIVNNNASSGLLPGTGTTVYFGAGSGLGRSIATTTVNNNGTLAGNGVVSGTVTASAGGRIAPGVNTVGNFGSAGTLTIGTLNLANTSHLDFDLASTAFGPNDLISTSGGALSLGAVNFTFYGLTPGVLETDTAYHLISVGSGVITGDTSGFTTTFDGTLPGYEATYSVDTVGGYVNVTFAAVPEPTSLSLVAMGGIAGFFLLRRRRQAL
jgi:PEP-CTERM motif